MRVAATICPHLARKLDLCRCDLETGVQVMCDMGYMSANFSLPRPVCSRPRPDIYMRRQAYSGVILTFHDTLHYTNYVVCVINLFSFIINSFLVLLTLLPA